MRARRISIPTFDEMYHLVPDDIRNYLDRCKDTPQSPDWHPEGDVYKHIKIVYDRAAETGDINQVMAALFHDLGKADVTHPSRNHKDSWSAYGHEAVSSRLVQKHKKWIGSMGARWFWVYQVVKEHMRVKRIGEMRKHKQDEIRNNPQFPRIDQFSQFDNMKTLTKDEMNSNA